MTDTPERCEPPEALRKRRWHYVTNADGRSLMVRWLGDMWEGGIMPDFPGQAAKSGWRYLSPAPSPAEIAALARAGLKAQHALQLAEDQNTRGLLHSTSEQMQETKNSRRAALTALSAALDAPSFKEIGDE